MIAAYDLRLLAAAAVAACGLLATAASQAASHALILTISDYDNRAFSPDRDPDLPGVRVDEGRALEIAQRLGVPRENVRQYRDEQLTLEGLRRAVTDFIDRVRPGERALIYYSGHGTQVPGAQPGRCGEAFVTYDGKLYFDAEFGRDLERLSQKAAQVVVLNDSCFSGGMAGSRSPGVRTLPDGASFRPRFYPYIEGFRPATADVAGYVCGIAINQPIRSASRSARALGSRVLYVAAAAETEVTYEDVGSVRGGVATAAWLQCLRNSAADIDKSGAITGEELQQCAQPLVDAQYATEPRRRHRITLIGDTRLPLGFVETQAPVLAAPLLEDLRARADPTFTVDLKLSATQLKTNVDFLDFTVRGSRGGYLYLLYVAPDSNKITVLFPNDIDKNNRIDGERVHRFPREGWRIRSRHRGDGHLLAIISDTPRDFTTGFQREGAFASTDASASSASRLASEAAPARYGASELRVVRQQP